uniref:Uncharacterized protein n=1 Tax=Haptolina brevifila TaxID=156173 RepID=A0A7S2MIS7_9EUKA
MYGAEQTTATSRAHQSMKERLQRVDMHLQNLLKHLIAMQGQTASASGLETLTTLVADVQSTIFKNSLEVLFSEMAHSDDPRIPTFSTAEPCRYSTPERARHSEGVVEHGSCQTKSFSSTESVRRASGVTEDLWYSPKKTDPASKADGQSVPGCAVDGEIFNLEACEAVQTTDGDAVSDSDYVTSNKDAVSLELDQLVTEMHRKVSDAVLSLHTGSHAAAYRAGTAAQSVGDLMPSDEDVTASPTERSGSNTMSKEHATASPSERSGTITMSKEHAQMQPVVGLADAILAMQEKVSDAERAALPPKHARMSAHRMRAAVVAQTVNDLLKF